MFSVVTSDNIQLSLNWTNPNRAQGGPLTKGSHTRQRWTVPFSCNPLLRECAKAAPIHRSLFSGTAGANMPAFRAMPLSNLFMIGRDENPRRMRRAIHARLRTPE